MVELKGFMDKPVKRLPRDRESRYKRSFSKWQDTAVKAEESGDNMDEWFKNNPCPLTYEEIQQKKRKVCIR